MDEKGSEVLWQVWMGRVREWTVGHIKAYEGREGKGVAGQGKKGQLRTGHAWTGQVREVLG